MEHGLSDQKQQQYQQIIEAAPMGMLLVNGNGEIVLINRMIETMFGYQREALLSKPVEILISGDLRQKHRLLREQFFSSLTSRLLGSGREFVGVKKDGGTLSLEIGLNSIELGAERFVLVLMTDISERKKTTEKVLNLSQAVDQSPAIVVITGIDGAIEYVNPMFEKTSGYMSHEVIGKNPRILKSGEQSAEFYAELWQTIKSGQIWRGELHNKNKNGGLYWVSASISPIMNTEGALTSFVAVEEDITEHKHSQEKLVLLNKELKKKSDLNEETVRLLDELVQTDPLTGLLNRRGLQRMLTREIAWGDRHGTDLLVVLLDLDNFKEVNDTHGHTAGDAVLQGIAKSLRGTLRSIDYVARIGGDEFIILLPQTRLSDGLVVAENIRLAILKTECVINGLPVRVTASLALVKITNDCPLVEDLVKKSQFVLKHSKVMGKNRISLDDRQQQKAIREVLEAMGQTKAYRVIKQPIVRLEDMSLWGYEFLSRLNVSHFEMPEDFFRLSRENQMLTMVDNFCLHHCVVAGQMIDKGVARHLNLYPSTAVEMRGQEILKEFPLECREAFCLEFSETMLPTDLTGLLKTLKVLKDAGIRIAIDGVSFGKSSLESLIMMEPDIVKLDRTINIGIARNSGRQRSLEKLLGVVRSLHAHTVVEGIERQDDLQVVRSMGAEYGQGFLLGRPC